MVWQFVLCDLNGVNIGGVTKAYERKLTLPLNGLPTASLKIRLDDPLADEVLSRLGDCLVKVYQGSTLRFIGEITDVEEIGAGGFYKRIIDRKGMVNVAYVLPTTWEPGTTAVAEVAAAVDNTSIDARGQYEEVIPADFPDPQLRQAWASANVERRKVPREIITFDPTANSDTEGTVAINAAGPLWHLQKRLLGLPYPSAASSWSGPANEIIDTWINQTNENRDSGVRLGTRDTLYDTEVGTATDESSYVFKPLAEGLTGLQEAKVAFPITNPPSFLRRDTFEMPPHTAGDLTGQAAPTGGNWTWPSFGDTRDFKIDAGSPSVALRQSVSDAGASAGRWLSCGASITGPIVIGLEWSVSYFTVPTLYQGMFVRLVDSNNWLLIYNNVPTKTIAIDKKVGGVQTTIASYTYPSGSEYGFNDAAFVWYQLIALIDDYGNLTVWQRGVGLPLEAPGIVATDADLASGSGTLDAGSVGIYDSQTSGGASNRVYENFYVAAYTGPQSFDFEIAPVEPTADASGYLGTLPYIGTLNVRTQIGTSKPEVIFEPGRTPEIFTDYIVGDYVTGRVKKSATTSRFNALFRVYSAEISVDDNGKASVVPELLPQ